MHKHFGDSFQSVVTVGISVYQQPLEWLKEAVTSVRAQSFERWELLIRPDGREAMDASGREWLKNMAAQESRICILNGNIRLGTFGSYHRLFSQSQSEYLVQLDADDLLDIEALRLSTAVLDQHPNSPFLYSQCTLINEFGSALGLDQRALRPWQKNIDLVQFIPFHLRVVRRSAYMQAGGYNSELKFTGDYDLSLRLAELGKPQHLPLSLYYYRVHASSISQSKRLRTNLEAVKAARAALKRRQMNESHDLIHSPNSESVSLVERFEGPIAVVGMHCCGAYFMALLLTKLGIDIGSRLLPDENRRSDSLQVEAPFFCLHRQWFESTLTNHPKGCREWGWNPEQLINCHGFSSWNASAEALLRYHQENATASRWGWKDPLTTLTLPFWHQLRPSLRIIGVYRTPWDLSDALQSLRTPHFRLHPEMILPLWRLYNQRLVDYVESNKESSLLVHTETLAANPNRLVDLLSDRWDWNFDDHYQEEDLSTQAGEIRLNGVDLPDPIVDLYFLVFPELMAIWLRLQKLADLPDKKAFSISKQFTLTSTQSALSPSLTVVITTSNPCHFLLEAIASVERHKSKEHVVEILIVDDGSIEVDSLHILERLQSVGYRVLRQEKSGIPAARNLGIQAASADLVLPLDDCNRLLGMYLNQAINFMQDKPDVDVFFGDRIDFGACNQIFSPGQFTPEQLLKSNRVDACALMRRTFLNKCAGFDENLNVFSDWDLWLTGLKLGMKTFYHPTPCFEYREWEGSGLRHHLSDRNIHHAAIDYLRIKHGIHVQSCLDGGY